ncbi:MAG: glycosyltransferase, partial [Blastocatellia bacterium]
MSDAPLVSIITIFLNAEQFFTEAIESIFAQTYTNWELFLVDDGSTDASTDLALRYAREYPERVTYLQHSNHHNRGMSASRNLGISAARGAFIAFLDADDIWLPYKLEEQVAILTSQPEAAMVYGEIQWWHSWTGEPEDADRDFIPELNVQRDTLVKPSELLIALLRNEGVTTTNGLIRRGVIERVGGYEESFHGMYEDQVFYAKVCLAAPVFVAGKCWYKWRKHPRSACALAVSNGQYESARLKFLNWLRTYLSRQPIRHDGVRKILYEETLKCRYPALFKLFKHVRYRALVAKEQSKAVVRRTLPHSARHWIGALGKGQHSRTTDRHRKRILVISAAFPPMSAGEADHTFHLCQHLAARELDVHLLTTLGDLGPTNPNFSVHRWMRNWSWRDLLRLAICLKRCSPDVVLLYYIGWIYNHHSMITFAATISKALRPRTPFIT